MRMPLSERGKGRYDVIVVGSGHNGLISAAYLAKAGSDLGVRDGLDPVSGLQPGDPGPWPLRKRAQNGRGSPHRSGVR
jgi:glycine/D-amino acid oxidase-like deaminating enzyme